MKDVCLSENGGGSDDFKEGLAIDWKYFSTVLVQEIKELEEKSPDQKVMPATYYDLLRVLYLMQRFCHLSTLERQRS